MYLMPLDDRIEIADSYHGLERQLLLLESEIRSLIVKLINASDIKGCEVTSRTKSLSSTIDKCFRKNKYEALTDITDLVGIRVITPFEKQVDIVAKIIESEFNIDSLNTIDAWITV